MPDPHNRDQWHHDIDARQRNVVFPDTVQNEARFWSNLGKQPLRTSTKVGLAILGVFVFGIWAALLAAIFQAGVTGWFVLEMLLFCGSIFGAIVWATRRNLRRIENEQRASRTPKH